MGHHWVPQKYLDGFATEADAKCIWQFDKRKGSFSPWPLAIKQVAQQKAFNDPATEADLNRIVEVPVLRILDSLRSGNPLVPEYRKPLSIYMATMLRRVPSKRSLAKSLFPHSRDRVVDEVIAGFREFAEANGGDETALQRAMNSAELARQKVADSDVTDIICDPWPTCEEVNAICSMSWQIIECSHGQAFITSDNPFFYFECYGLGTAKAEFTFPISSSLAIFGSPTRHESDRAISSFHVEEANRRIACAAERFIYCSSAFPWVKVLSEMRVESLSRIG